MTGACGYELEISVRDVIALEHDPDAFCAWLYELDRDYDITDVESLIGFFIQRQNFTIVELLINFKYEKNL